MGINVENILRVADAIEHHSIPDLGFNMFDYTMDAGDLAHFGVSDMSGHNCGTTACIAGWALAVRDEGKLPDVEDYHAEAANFLELPLRTSEALFLHWNDGTTPAEAVAVLRHLAATGEVDWSISSPEAA